MAFTRARLWAVCTALSIVGPALVAGEAYAADTPSCASFNVTVRQLVRPTSGTNLLTRWDTEALIAKEQYGYTSDQGDLAKVAGNDGTGLGAVWRLYRAGDFVWALEGQDADAMVQQGYQRQFVDFYAGTEKIDCLDAIYRFKKGSVHRVATAADAEDLVNAGWTREQVSFYADIDGAAGPAPVPGPDPAPDPGTDTKFSVAVIPDTQNEMTNPADTRFKNRATWLAENKSALDLRYAIQIGDLTNWGQVVPSQFDKAGTDIKPLEAAVPWAGAIGNHDTAAVCIGGSACPGANTNVAVRNTSAFNNTFPPSRFPRLGGTFEAGKVDNAYQTFTAGGVDWMVLTLELWPRASAVNWAKSVVGSHPDHNVVVVTHAYLEGDGSISGSNGGYGATSPQYLFDNLIKVYPNVRMVLSGHVGDSAVRTDTGNQGNKIVSLLQTFHSWTNPVRLVEIDTAAGTVTSKVYAPASQTDFPNASTWTNGLNFVR